MRGQFFIIAATVMISFLLFITLFISQYPSPSSSFSAKNDVYFGSNLLIEIQHLIEAGQFGAVANFTNYTSSELSNYTYSLSETYGYSPISGETDIDMDYNNPTQKGTRSAAETTYICNNYNTTSSFDLYWNACMFGSQANPVSDKECNIILDPFECYESDLLMKIPGNRDLVVFTAVNSSNQEIMNLCIYTGTGNLTYSNTSSMGVYLQLNLTSFDSSLYINSLYKTPYCLNHCPKQDVSSCG